MKTLILAAVAILAAALALAQDAAASPEQLVLPGATLAPDCGNLYGRRRVPAASCFLLF